MKKREVYLDNIPLIEAERIWLTIMEGIEPWSLEIVDVRKPLTG